MILRWSLGAVVWALLFSTRRCLAARLSRQVGEANEPGPAVGMFTTAGTCQGRLRSPTDLNGSGRLHRYLRIRRLRWCPILGAKRERLAARMCGQIRSA